MVSKSNLLDIYTDYLITSTRQTTATELSRVFSGSISHDKITRFLNTSTLDNRDLWMLVKPKVRQIEGEESVLIVDDTISEKPYTDENHIVCYHYDHSKGRSLKGINMVNLILSNKQEIRIPLSVEVVTKDIEVIDKEGKKRLKSSMTKNELFQSQFKQAINNKVVFKYVLADIWFANGANMQLIRSKGKHFIVPLKKNRQVCIFKKGDKSIKYQSVESLNIEEGQTVRIRLKGYKRSLLLCKQVFRNKDGSTGVLYLVCSDLTADFSLITTTYQRRWGVETYHRSLKNNTSLSASPTRRVRSQMNHIYAAIIAFVKLEAMKMNQKLNHYALKSKLYLAGMKTMMEQLHELKYGTQLVFEF